jgi:hypothetical protein
MSAVARVPTAPDGADVMISTNCPAARFTIHDALPTTLVAAATPLAETSVPLRVVTPLIRKSSLRRPEPPCPAHEADVCTS